MARKVIFREQRNYDSRVRENVATRRQPPEVSKPSEWQEHRKARTRQAMFESAMRLFDSQGYAATTVTQIAEEAGFAERTFFLHFRTKADVLFDVQPEDLRELTKLVVGQPEAFDDLDVVLHAMVKWHESRDTRARHAMVRILKEAAASSAVIRGREMDYNQGLTDAVATGLAVRRGEPSSRPSRHSRIMAAVTMRLLHLFVEEWSRAKPGAYASLLSAHFDAFRGAMAEGSTATHP
jgi:AcrR family transcriptional regulator